ncbi:MAG: glycosyltransferase family 39 protein [Chloroflexota bacterium]|nr:glycosyltransferase family 39 protein [Chloroflexota bacterium]
MAHIQARWLFSTVGILLVVFALSVFQLNQDGVWFDEWWSLYNGGDPSFGAALSPAEIWQRAAQDPVHPPGYYFLLSVWSNIAGWDLVAGRLLSLFAGLLALAVTYQLAITLTHDARVGVASVVALGGSAWFLHFTHELRMYAFMVLLAGALLLLYIRIMRQQRPPFVAYLALALVTAAFVYVHYFAIPFLIIIALWHLSRLASARPNRHWWSVAITMTLGTVTLLPWLDVLLHATELIAGEDRITWTGWGVLALPVDILMIFSSGALVLLALYAWSSLALRPARMVWLLAVGVIFISLPVYYTLNINETRYSVSVMPLLALGVGMGMAALIRRRVPLLVLTIVWFGAGLLVRGNADFMRLIQRTPSQPLREMAAVIAPYVQESDVTINHVADDMVSAIQGHPFVHYFGSLPGRKEIVEMETLPSPEAFVARVDEAVGDARRVHLVYAPQYPSAEWSLLLQRLNELGYAQCAVHVDSLQMIVASYGQTRGAPAVEFQQGIRAHLVDTPIARNDVLQVWLILDSAAPPDTYSVGVHLLDMQGNLVAQSDFGLASGGNCHLVTLPLTALAAGEYELALLVYDWRTGARLTLADGSAETYGLATIERSLFDD